MRLDLLSFTKERKMKLRGASSGLLMLIIAAILTSCSGDISSPVSPSSDPGPPLAAINNSSSSGHQFMGYSLIELDTSNGSIDVIPLRETNFHLNVVGILNSTMGIGAAGVPGEADPPNGLFVFDITLSHPLSNSKFSGFDVKGILMAPGSYVVGPLLFSGLNETRLLNADGYTRWWNPTEFTSGGMFGYTKGILASAPAGVLTATINPYKYFADALFPDSTMSAVQNAPLDADDGRGIFSAGASNSRRYRIQFEMDPGPKIVFGYAVDASWIAPTVNPPVEVPDDFPISANQPEAYNIAISDTFNTLFYDTESGLGGGLLQMQVNAHDWQGQMAGAIKDEVEVVRIFSPDLFASGVNAAFKEETATKAVYTADLSGVAVPTHSGETPIFVRVGSMGGPDYNQGFGAAPDSPVSAWNVYSLDIPDPDCAADTNNTPAEAEALDHVTPVTANLCYPTDGEDYYLITVPLGYKISGTVTLYCDADGSSIGLYDSSENLLGQVDLFDGSGTINVGSTIILPGSYYLKVSSTGDNQAVIYYMVPNLELTDNSPTAPVDITPAGLFIDSWWVDRFGNYLLLSGPTGLWIFRDADPYEFVRFEGITNTVKPKHNSTYLYFAIVDTSFNYHLGIADLSNPESPVITNDIIVTEDWVNSMAVDDNTLFICWYDGSNNRLSWYDISGDSLNPVLKNETPLPDLAKDMQLMTAGASRFIVTASLERLQYYNITNINSVTFDSETVWPGGNSTRNFDVQSDHVYALTYYEPTTTTSLQIFQKNPSTGVTPRGTSALPHDANFVSVDNNTASVGNTDNYLTTVDTTNLNLPAILTSELSPHNTPIYDVLADGSSVITVEQQTGFVEYDVSVPSSPTVNQAWLGLTSPRSSVYDETSDSLYFYESGAFFKGIKSLTSASTPESATVADAIGADYKPVAIDVNNGNLAAAEISFHWQLFDVSDPADIASVDTYSTAGDAVSIAITDKNVYVGLGINNIIEVYRLLPAGNAEYFGNVGSDGKTVLGFAFYNDTMYAYTAGDVLIYDITDAPNSPVLSGSYDNTGSVGDMIVQANLLLLGKDEGLEVLDISSPLSPVKFADEPVAYVSNDVELAVDSAYLYMNGPEDQPTLQIYLLPFDDPNNLGEIYGAGSYEVVRDLSFAGGNLYECVPFTGVRIFDFYN